MRDVSASYIVIHNLRDMMIHDDLRSKEKRDGRMEIGGWGQKLDDADVLKTFEH